MSAFRWKTPLDVDEFWLNSDRQILARVQETPDPQGVMFTINLPGNQQYQAILQNKNADSGSQFCQSLREYYNEWKASKEDASRRSIRDREQHTLVGAERGAQDDLAGHTVQETVQALEDAVQGTASLEEEIVRRYDKAISLREKLAEAKRELDIKTDAAERDIQQLEQMMEIFRASKILEKASQSILTDVRGSSGRVEPDTRGTEDK